MKFLFLAVFVSAVLIQVWRNLAQETRATVEARAKLMLTKAVEMARKAQDRIFRRRMSYRHVFMSDRGDLSPAARIVIADLTRFCRGMTSTTVVSPVSKQVDPVASALAEGRREVWLYLMKQLHVDPSQVIGVMTEEDALAA